VEKVETTMEKTYHLIFNPVAGPADPEVKLADIKAALATLPDLTVHCTQPDLAVEQLTQQVVAAGADVVIVAGGDGTLSGVAAALVHTDIALGIIPTGTVNALAAALKIPENVAEAAAIIQADHRQAVDTACCNGKTLLLLACIGFEAHLLRRLNRQEQLQLGKLAIAFRTVQAWFTVKPFEAEVTTPGQHWQGQAMAITLANATTTSTMLAHGPAETAADDGVLSITVVTPRHKWGMVTAVANLLLSRWQHRDVQTETVHSYQATQVTVTTPSPQAVFADGEPAGTTPVTVTCQPRSLIVLTSA
jgi:YegS/Rv2252/BmrU family lipid kinase